MAFSTYDTDRDEYLIVSRNALGRYDPLVDENGRPVPLKREVQALSGPAEFTALFNRLIKAVTRMEAPETASQLRSRAEPCEAVSGPIRGTFRANEWTDSPDQEKIARRPDPVERTYHKPKGRWKVNIVWPTKEEMRGKPTEGFTKRNGRMWVDEEEIDIDRMSETMNDVPPWADEFIKWPYENLDPERTYRYRMYREYGEPPRNTQATDEGTRAHNEHVEETTRQWKTEFKMDPDSEVYKQFMEASLRDVAATMGMSYEEVTEHMNALKRSAAEAKVRAEEFESVLKAVKEKMPKREHTHPTSPRKGRQENYRGKRGHGRQ